MPITFGSVCSGIEAASVAWEPLGFTPAWFAQFDPEHNYNSGPDFPSAVLAHHWPHVPNLRDMTEIAEAIEMEIVEAPLILVGGTPCQAYSVAGRREGLLDPRGMLTLKFVEIADAIDRQRGAGDECVVVWENVPGVLSSKDNAFGCLLGDLAGEDCELVAPGGKWANAGCVFGPKRTVAWRILDAQYFGVAQRRRRVFVVASARVGFDPTAVLFERDGLRRDTPPSRETGPRPTPLAADGIGERGQPRHIKPILVVSTGGPDDAVTYPLLEIGKRTGTSTTDPRAGLGVGAECDPMFTLQAGAQHGVAYGTRTANTSSNGWGIQEEVTHTLDTAQGIAVAFAENSRQEVRLEGGDGQVTGALSCGGGKAGQGYPAAVVSMAFRASGQESLTPWEQQGRRIQGPNGVAPTLMCNPAGGMKLEPILVSEPTPINLQVITRHESLGRGTGFGLGEHGEAAYTLGAGPMHGIWHGLAVRRLMPVECERLQGFPDNHTLIPYRGKPAADSHRYKAIGNSMAVPVMKWIGKRIRRNLPPEYLDI